MAESESALIHARAELGKLQLINTQITNQTPREFDAHSGSVTEVKFVPGKNAMISSGTDNLVKYWDLLTNESKTIFQDNSGITDIAPSPSGKKVICVTTNGKLLQWTASTSAKKLIYTHHPTFRTTIIYMIR